MIYQRLRRCQPALNPTGVTYTYDKLGERIQAIHNSLASMRTIGSKRRKDPAAAVDQSRRLLAAGRHEENFALLREAVQRFPEDPEIQLLYATTLLAFRPENVVAEVSKAVELGPDDPVVLVQAAHLMFDHGERETARSYTAHANELVEPDFVLMSGLEHLNGLFAGIDGDYELAEEKLRRAMESDPSFSSVAIDLAKLLMHQGRNDEALEVVNEAMKHAKETTGLERLRGELAGGAPGS